jgi:hypothetical protein
MVGVLAAAWHFAERLNAPLLLIHAGAPHAQKQAEFRDAIFQLKMPRETRIVWNEGEPAEAIVTAAEKEGAKPCIPARARGVKRKFRRKKKPGQPDDSRKLCDRLRKDICQNIRRGLSKEDASRLCGITRETLRQWRGEAKKS